ncbi:hypothetical protein M5D96_003526 [Drosophila gunungcola]|uniref:Uncharacterized protein n=1 Tax=Drosophila gunungcola TaxID=103775 RepID=A0A9P9YT69_9MUSC|nr:hypothetical protein M5D96_003526 [Drosophila gunungcola]
MPLCTKAPRRRQRRTNKEHLFSMCQPRFIHIYVFRKPVQSVATPLHSTSLQLQFHAGISETQRILQSLMSPHKSRLALCFMI